MRILLVDKDPMTRFVLRKEVAASLCADITEAEDGLEALLHLENRAFDIVISDHHVGRVSGIDLLRFVEGHPKKAAVFVIFTADALMVEALRKSKRCPAYFKTDLQSLLKHIQEACCINFYC